MDWFQFECGDFGFGFGFGFEFGFRVWVRDENLRSGMFRNERKMCSFAQT